MSQNLVRFRNNIKIIRRYKNILASLETDINEFSKSHNLTVHGFFIQILAKNEIVFENFKIRNYLKKFQKNSWNPSQILFLYKFMKNRANAKLVKELMEVVEQINEDSINSPFRLAWIQAFFMKRSKNFHSRYYWPERWGTDPDFMEDVYKVLLYGESFDLDSIKL